MKRGELAVSSRPDYEEESSEDDEAEEQKRRRRGGGGGGEQESCIVFQKENLSDIQTRRRCGTV